jgi:predicted metal-dependent hydrolase
MRPSLLTLDDLVIPLESAGPARQARLTVERDGSLLLRAADDVGWDELREFVASRRRWIYKRLAAKQALPYKLVAKGVADGEVFAYLGRSYALQIAGEEAATVKLQRGRLLLTAPAAELGASAIVAWYQERGHAWLSSRIQDWAKRLRVEVTRFEIGDLGHRWGTADIRGSIRFHWAVMQLRPQLIDYVIAHELAHLIEPHHGPSFWRLLSTVLPDFERRKQALAQAGLRVWFGHLEGGPAVTPQRPPVPAGQPRSRPDARPLSAASASRGQRSVEGRR